MRYVWLLCLSILLPLSVCSQQGTIAYVQWEGCQRNDTTYLERFISITPGDTFSLERVATDLQRLRNLYSVANARFRLDTLTRDRLGLVIEVEEAWTLFPIVSVTGVRSNTWYEIGASEINLLGRGMNLTLAYRNIDGRSNYQVFFQQPYVLGSRWGLLAGIHRYASTEPLFFPEGTVFYNYTNWSFDVGISYEFTQGHSLQFGANYFIEGYAKTPDQPLENPPGPDELTIPKGLFKLIHRLDRVNYDYFYQDGFSNTTSVEAVYNSDDGSWFNLMLNDFHFFRRTGQRGNLAMRLRLGLSTNLNSPFAPFVLDSRFNIRGAGNRIDRGTGTLVFNAEYRHTLFERDLVAVQGVAFSDLGAWRSAGGDFDELFDPEFLRHFVGPGIRFIYKKAHNAVLRIDYGFDLYQPGERGVVFGFGQYF